MKERIVGLLKTYGLLVALFVLQKPLFMLCYHSIYDETAWTDWLKVMWHGLPLDLSLAGYLSAVPALLYVISVWTLHKPLRQIWKGYFAVVSILLSVIFIVDLALYGFWGFRLDATPLFYFFSSPKDCLASVSGWFVACGVTGMIVCALALFCLFNHLLLRQKQFMAMKLPYRRLEASSILLLLAALLFIPIRGGFTVSTMNTGKVYFSTNQRLNHAATNPAFNLMESLSKQADFTAQYRYMDNDQATRLFQHLLDPQVPTARQASPTDSLTTDSTTHLFNARRPDVMIVILESFSSKLMNTLGGEPNVAINLDSLGQEGILFTNFYANSFRTDRGLVSILSGYPAPPTYSVMKNPRKTQHLPSIAGSLKKAGYATYYYYGGDADFTNMRSYLMSSGFEAIVSDRDFPLSQRLSKWGVHDHLLFGKLIDDLKKEARQATDTTHHVPTYRVIQTSSSHEPFEVPFRRLTNDRLNAFAYTDSCIGDFVRQFRKLPQWENTVMILVPDHLGGYPEQINNFEESRYRIPLIMVGGAITHPQRVNTYGSQQDIAATLLAQLGLPHGEFTFSKDLFDPQAPHFAFFTVPDAFGMATQENCLIFDNQSKTIVLDNGTEKSKNLLPGQAYLQKLYDDLDKR